MQMPVPVPRVVKTTAHPVIKRTRGIAPVNKPATRSNSRPRRIWEEDSCFAEQQHTTKQGFNQGLTVADNAMAIKGTRAQACIPPQVSIPNNYALSASQSRKERGRDARRWEQEEDEFDMPCELGDMMGMDKDIDGEMTSPDLVFSQLATYENQPPRISSYNPTYRDHSPSTDSGPDSASSPLGPITPFADFIDRAVAAEQHHSATAGFRQLALPLSEWLANYVWRVCTTGLSLSPVFTYPSGRVVHYSPIPPSYLAPSIHSLLLSTLLQPSAVFLALWYIIRLPVCFNSAELGAEYPKEASFRHALLGEPFTYEREALELKAPFRMIVLGCMLANEWLDDHMFSNKTWHTISNIPVHELNKLEIIVLEVFDYNLAISNEEWSHWMSHVKSYHMSLAPSQLQPIGQPSSNPHSIIRKSIDEILQAPSPVSFSPLPQPVFLGIEERKRQSLDKHYGAPVDVIEIDLDEGGPLREEYLPRRRVGHDAPLSADRNHTQAAQDLPPPAKWNPSGDEPILRDRNRSSGQYVAIQLSHPSAYPVGCCPLDMPLNPQQQPQTPPIMMPMAPPTIIQGGRSPSQGSCRSYLLHSPRHMQGVPGQAPATAIGSSQTHQPLKP
ncbi:hypothetical protein BKA70DRAFT_362752 [Coprinopsis sp. MPI-PUGE-AT-0042]|nr:hypothetical protein BKA70DRAFT_362752 [Coprinopsis sp. MPI-PUGE-AT-0042]